MEIQVSLLLTYRGFKLCLLLYSGLLLLVGLHLMNEWIDNAVRIQWEDACKRHI